MVKLLISQLMLAILVVVQLSVITVHTFAIIKHNTDCRDRKWEYECSLRVRIFFRVTLELPNPFAEAIIYICIQSNPYFQLNSLFCMLYQIDQNYFTGALHKLLNVILDLLGLLLAVIFSTAPESFEFCNFLIPNSGVTVNRESDAVNNDSGKGHRRRNYFFRYWVTSLKSSLVIPSRTGCSQFL